MGFSFKEVVPFLLIFLIILGIFFRIYNLNYPLFCFDDAVFAISSLKIHHQSFEAGVEYVWNHPPLGKYLAGIFTIGMDNPAFQVLAYLPAQMSAYAQLVGKALSLTIFRLRLSYLFFGLLSIFLIFLITKKIYSTKVALWATALFSVSLDFISLTRNLYPEHLMVFLILLSLYFYIEYIYFSKKKILLLPLFITLLFLLGSRQFQPVLFSVFLFSHYIFRNYFLTKDFNRTLNKSLDLIILYVCLLIGFFITYSPLPPKEISAASSIIFGFQIKRIIEVFLFRNSYLSLLGFVMLIYLLFIKRAFLKKVIKNPSKLFNKKMLIPYLFLVNLASMLIFDFGDAVISRYMVHVGVLLIILEGIALNDLIEQNKKILNILLILFLIFTCYQIVDSSKSVPPFSLNSNFNIEKYAFFPDLYDTGYNETIYSELEKLGNPPVLTNLVWLQTYYSGESFPTPMEQFGMCTNEFFNQVREKNVLIVVRSPNFFNDPWAACGTFRTAEFEKIKEFNVLSRSTDKKTTLLILRLKNWTNLSMDNNPKTL